MSSSQEDLDDHRSTRLYTPSTLFSHFKICAGPKQLWEVSKGEQSQSMIQSRTRGSRTTREYETGLEDADLTKLEIQIS